SSGPTVYQPSVLSSSKHADGAAPSTVAVSAESIPLIARAQAHRDRRALIAPDGTWAYADLLARSARVAAGLLGGAADLDGARVAFLVQPSCAHVAVQWGIWRAGGVAVPL